MKVAITADIHIGHNISNSFRIYDSLYSLDQIKDYCISNSIDNIFIAGDLFHKRDGFTSVVLCESYKFLETIKDNNLNLNVIAGNHDQPYKVFIKGQNNIRHLSSIANVFHKSMCQKVDLGDTSFWFLHWIDNCETIKKIVNIIYEKMDTSRKNVLISHLMIKSFQNDNGTFNMTGFDPNIFYKFDKVFLGHLHRFQQKKNIIYVGSPLELNFGERKYDHGFCVYDTESGEFDFHKLNYRRFIDYTFDKADEISDEYLESIKGTINNNIVNVHINEYVVSSDLKEIRNKIKQICYPKILKIDCVSANIKNATGYKDNNSEIMLLEDDIEKLSMNWLEKESNISQDKHKKITSMIANIKDIVKSTIDEDE
jgi:DNA repair exonuclease SbcCD nuclease subunit